MFGKKKVNYDEFSGSDSEFLDDVFCQITQQEQDGGKPNAIGGATSSEHKGQDYDNVLDEVFEEFYEKDSEKKDGENGGNVQDLIGCAKSSEPKGQDDNDKSFAEVAQALAQALAMKSAIENAPYDIARVELTSTAIGMGLSVLCSQKPMVDFVFNRFPMTFIDKVFLSNMPNMLYINSDIARLGLSIGYAIGLGHCAFNLGYAVKAVVSCVELKEQNYLDYAANTVSVLSLAYTGYQMYKGAIGFADVKVQAVTCAISMCGCLSKYINQSHAKQTDGEIEQDNVHNPGVD